MVVREETSRQGASNTGAALTKTPFVFEREAMTVRHSSRAVNAATTTPAVGYIRMSTDQQQDSPARQRRDIEAMAERQSYQIIKWYEDHGQSGTESSKRREFQQLLSDAKGGKFQAVLLSEQSRMSREDIFDAMQHWRKLRDAGVKIVTSQRGELNFNNLGGVITAIVDQYGAREESIKLAQRVVSGQRMKARQGQRIGGMVFGYDRELIDDAGKVVRQIHFRERFRKPVTWRTRLVPSDDEAAVEAVQWAFNAVSKGQSVCSIAREFNKRGLTTVWGNKFTYGSVLGILSNPTYTGALHAGRYSRGKFCTLGDEGLIVVEDAHEPLVTQALYERVTKILADRTYRCERANPGKYLLTGMVQCSLCGDRVYGIPRRKRGEPVVLYYQCNPSPAMNGSSDCPHPAVRVERLEKFVLDTIRDRLLNGKVEAAIREAILRAKRRDAPQASCDEKKLQDIRRKIERGTENLALAERDNFAAISKLLTQWREEEIQLVERLQNRGRELEPLPEALSVLAKFDKIRERIGQADRAKLAHAIRQTVASITIGTRKAKAGTIDYNEHYGELRFNQNLGIDKAIPIPDEAIGQRRIWREIGELARRSKKTIHLKDVCEIIGSSCPSRACHNVRRAEAAGLIKKIGGKGTGGGWVPVV